MVLMVSFGNLKEVLMIPLVEVSCRYESKIKGELTGNIELAITNKSKDSITVEIKDNSYKQASQSKTIASGASAKVVVDLKKSFGWYDTSLVIKGKPEFEKRFAGRVETGEERVSDPAIG